MEIRRNPITGEPIIFAPERADRPNAFGRSAVEVCPFCPGNEHLTPQEIRRAGEPWRVRVFPNKYPAVAGHEVIVDSPQHDTAVPDDDHAREALEICVERYQAHSEAAFVAFFRNHGRAGGASIDHLHSQLMPLPFVPPRLAREGEAFEAASTCPLCALLGADGEARYTIEENAACARMAPPGSSHAYQQWIVPKGHYREMTDLGPDEREALSLMLQAGSRAATRVAPSYNVLYMNFPRHRSAHFYVDLFPRMTAIAGFELGAGTFIDIIDPAAAARILR